MVIRGWLGRWAEADWRGIATGAGVSGLLENVLGTDGAWFIGCYTLCYIEEMVNTYAQV